MGFGPVLRLAAALAGLSSFAFAQQPVPAALAQATAGVQAAVDAGQAASAQTHGALDARREMLLDVFRNDPASARAYALPAATRQALLAADPAAAALLEYDVTKTGELTESVADRWADGTSSTRYGLHTATDDLDLALPAAVLATAPANHQRVTVHGLALGDVIAAERLTAASPVDAADCATPARQNAALQPKAVPLTCSTFGEQRVAVLIVNFPAATPSLPTGMDQAAYWNQVLFGANPSVNTYWNEVSQGQTSAAGDVYGPFTLAQQYDCTTTTGMQTAAIAAAIGTVDFSQYNRVVIVFPAANSCTFGGLANVGCVSATTAIAHQYSVVWMPIFPNYKPNFTSPEMWGGTSHELGHNLGLNHANTLDFNALALGPLDFSTTNPGVVVGFGGSTGSGSNVSAVNTEYGDTFDVMGYPWTGGGPYNAVHRAKTLGWIAQADEREVTAAGTYTLVPAEDATGLRALHVLRDAAYGAWLWVEFHQPTGYYEGGNYQAHIGYGDRETVGAQIHYETPLSSAAYTYLLDMTPAASATTGNNNFYDGNLAPGTSWSDPYSLLTITANAQSAAGLGVTVSYDTPCATLALSSASIAAAGGAGMLTITAPTGCSWAVSSNALWITFPGATSGSGSAVIPFAAAANTAGTQRNTYLTAQRQSVALVQAGTSVTLVGLTPNQGSSVAGGATPFTLTLSDAAGLSDFVQLNLNYSGFATPGCQPAVVWNDGNPYLYLYNSSTQAYTGGILPGSGNTLTSASCSLSGAASRFSVSGTTATITLGLTFPPEFVGEHNVTGYAYGQNSQTATLPLGIWIVAPVAATTSTTTTTQLRLNPNTSVQGSQAILAAAVMPAGATGTVTFIDQTNATAPVTVGTATLDSNGNASALNTTLAVGAHSLVARYNGDTNYSASTSPAATLTITPNPATTTTLTASATTILPSGSVTLTAQVGAGSGAAQPGGSVDFTDGGRTIASVTLTGGSATYTAAGLSTGTHPFAAVYSGSAGAFLGSASVPVTVSMQDFALALPAGAASLNAGASESFPLTLTPGVTGFSTAVALACSGAPALATCTIAPGSLTPGNGPAAATLTLATTARPSTSGGWLLLGLAPGLLALRRRHRARLAGMLTGWAALAVLVLAGGCGQGNFFATRAGGGTPAGTYSVTVTGTATGATTLTHTTTLSLKVN